MIEITVTSKTPRREIYYGASNRLFLGNRKSRRAAVYGSSSTYRLQEQIKILRNDMIAAGIYPPPVPSSGQGMSRCRKVLSGYHGRLCELAREGV